MSGTRSTLTTSAPLARRRFFKMPPKNPAPPVTRTFAILTSVPCRLRSIHTIRVGRAGEFAYILSVISILPMRPACLSDAGELGHAADVVPIRHVDVGLL